MLSETVHHYFVFLVAVTPCTNAIVMNKREVRKLLTLVIIKQAFASSMIERKTIKWLEIWARNIVHAFL
jgi:hypothetical protein